MKIKILFLVLLSFLSIRTSFHNRLTTLHGVHQALVSCRESLNHCFDEGLQIQNVESARAWYDLEYTKFLKMREEMFDVYMQQNLSQADEQVRNECAIIIGEMIVKSSFVKVLFDK